MDAATEESADRQHDRRRGKRDARRGHDALDATGLDREIRRLLLEDRKIRLVLERASYRAPVELAVRLGARRAHRGPLARVQRAELDARAVRGPRHRAAERVDLPDQMTLADAADRRVAAHLAQRLDVLREQQRARAEASRGERCLGAGVAAAYHDDVELFREPHLSISGPRIVWETGTVPRSLASVLRRAGRRRSTKRRAWRS